MRDEDGLRSVGSRAFDGALITLAYLPIIFFLARIFRATQE